MLAQWGNLPPIDLPTEPIGHFNASPGAKHWTFRERQDGTPVVEPIRWHYLSPWAAKKGLPPAINARLDKLLTPYYRGLMKTGRIIVPADGWFEWTGTKTNREPWYIRPKNDKPLFFAALSNHADATEDPERAGFVIVTDESAGGMVDVHDRRPIALTAEDARLWMEPETPYEQAEQVARTTALREDYFQWYRVSQDVNNARHNGQQLIAPLET